MAKNRSPSTVTNYLGAARTFEEWLLETGHSGNLEDIGSADIERFTVDQLKWRSASTASTRFRCLQQLFKWLANEDEIDADPTEGLSPPTVPEVPIPILTEDELRALLDVTSGKGFDRRRDHAILRVLIDTGVRVGELVKIELEDVDLSSGTILVHGKGARSRHVPLGLRSIEALDRYLRERRRQVPETESALWIGPARATTGDLCSRRAENRSRARMGCSIGAGRFARKPCLAHRVRLRFLDVDRINRTRFLADWF